MDNSYIRIKFTPLMKCVSKLNSNYSVEIIPIVTCIKNINKLALKNEERSAEYVIPMTYKIVIKKQDVDCCLKIYHSCVDLLPSSSLFHLDNFSSNVPQCTLSENYILNKISSLVDIESINLELRNKEINKNTILKNDNVQDNNYKKQTNDQSTSFVEDEDISKLISPYLEEKNYPFKMQLYRNNNEDVISYTKRFRHKKSDLQLNYEQTFINIDCDYDIIFKKTLNTNTKLLPEERVALFKKTMENFVYPLKVAINDIINKCINLGIYPLLKESNNNKNITNRNSYSYFKKSCKSNRMVYSIIFDE